MSVLHRISQSTCRCLSRASAASPLNHSNNTLLQYSTVYCNSLSAPSSTVLNNTRFLQTESSQTKSDDKTVHLSASCVSQLLRVAGSNERLRLTVDSGGCSGFEYKFTLDDVPITADDTVISQGGVNFVVDELSLDMIKGATIDFESSLIRASFRVMDNPQSEGGCSCGASFAPKL